MKRIVIFMLSAVMAMALSGCTVYEDGDTAVLLPMYDGGLGMSFEKSNRSVEALPVNLTSEQADELFGSIEVFGANLTLPMRVSDLPEGFEMNYDFDKDDLTRIDEALYINENVIRFSNDEGAVMIAGVVILMEGTEPEDLKNGYIVGYDLPMLLDQAVGVAKIKGVGVGTLFNEEMTTAYGEGYYCTAGNFVTRAYSDGERTLQIVYLVKKHDCRDENGEIDMERLLKEGTPFSISLTVFPEYEMIYRMD